MTNCPTRHVLGYAAGSLRTAFVLPTDTAGAVATTVAAGVAWAFGPANAGILACAAAAMLLDLMVGSLRAALDPLDDFTVAKLYGGFLGKIFRAFLIPTGALVDRTLLWSGMPLPEGYVDTFPATKIVALGLVYTEIVSVLRHFREGGVQPGLLALVMRHLDKIKLGEEPPVRRDYDVAAIVEEEKRRTRGDP